MFFGKVQLCLAFVSFCLFVCLFTLSAFQEIAFLVDLTLYPFLTGFLLSLKNPFEKLVHLVWSAILLFFSLPFFPPLLGMQALRVPDQKKAQVWIKVFNFGDAYWKSQCVVSNLLY